MHPDPQDPNSPLIGKRILVAEDRQAIAGWAVRTLRALGCHPLGPAATVRDGLALVEREHHRIDAALLDIDLRGMLVYPLARVLVRAGKPILFATGFGSPAIAGEWRGFPRIEKPYAAGELKRALCAALSQDHSAPSAEQESYDISDMVRRAWDAIREGRNAQTEHLIQGAPLIRQPDGSGHG